MSNSESQNRKGKGGRKPKFDYTSEDFLSLVESYAKKGFTDKEIAYSLGLCPQTFCEKKSEYSELCEVLTRGRATITAAVRAKFLAMAMGGVRVKSETRRFVQEKCHCMGEDEKCPDCGGTGWVTLTDKSIVQETISELAPSLQAQSVILYHYDPDWKNVERKQDDDEDNEVDIDESKWITNAGN
nr:MAG TPA: terminase small subunit [Bacteriophage sp.]